MSRPLPYHFHSLFHTAFLSLTYLSYLLYLPKRSGGEVIIEKWWGSWSRKIGGVRCLGQGHLAKRPASPLRFTSRLYRHLHQACPHFPYGGYTLCTLLSN